MSGALNLGACGVGRQLYALPKIGPNQPGAQFDGQALAELVAANAPVPDVLPSLTGTLPCPVISVTPSQSRLSVTQPAQTVQLVSSLASGGTATFSYRSSNPKVASVHLTTGLVTVTGTGIATISATAPNQSCPAQAAIVVDAETYSGTLSARVTTSVPFPGGFTPNPLIIEAVVDSAPIQLVVAQSLLQSGTFAGFLTDGPSTVTVTIPTLACKTCDPPVTIPGTTTVTPSPKSSGQVTGMSDGSIIRIPMGGGFPPMTGTVSVLGPVVQVTLNWSFEFAAAGSVTTVQYSANLTKQ